MGFLGKKYKPGTVFALRITGLVSNALYKGEEEA
jgi:hypothetical protein